MRLRERESEALRITAATCRGAGGSVMSPDASARMGHFGTAGIALADQDWAAIFLSAGLGPHDSGPVDFENGHENGRENVSDQSFPAPTTMKAWVTRSHGDLELEARPVPHPQAGELLLKVEACGVCRTDLHVIDGELPAHNEDIIPGHQIVGRVVAGETADIPRGTRVGAAWLRSTCGSCNYCRSGRENLCARSRYTGWDANGGFAEYAVAPAEFCCEVPEGVDAELVAPLLCAGIIGYRALERASLPPGGRLGLYGFGSSAHLTAQLAMAAGAEVFVMTRGQENQALAKRMNVAFVGGENDTPPVPLDSSIIFSPVGTAIPMALAATAPGGCVVVAGIHLSDIPSMAYEASIFHERDLRTVTSNTRADGMAFLRLAQQLDLRPQVTSYPLERAGAAVDDLRRGVGSGSLVISSP